MPMILEYFDIFPDKSNSPTNDCRQYLNIKNSIVKTSYDKLNIHQIRKYKISFKKNTRMTIIVFSLYSLKRYVIKK
jgi:hypothetical protein